MTPHLVALAASLLVGDTSGVFILHKIGNPIGRETWHITEERSGTRRLSTSFTFTDRGTPITLVSTLDYAASGRPTHFTLGGQTSRMSTVDLDVTLLGDSATIREDSTVTTVLARGAFPARGYAPMAIQQAIMREWLRRGRPRTLDLVPARHWRSRHGAPTPSTWLTGPPCCSGSAWPA